MIDCEIYTELEQSSRKSLKLVNNKKTQVLDSLLQDDQHDDLQENQALLVENASVSSSNVSGAVGSAKSSNSSAKSKDLIDRSFSIETPSSIRKLGFVMGFFLVIVVTLIGKISINNSI